jgi:hypothetical protein
MFAVIAFILGIIAAVLAWLGKTPYDTAFFYAAVAFIALHLAYPGNPFRQTTRRPVA